MKKILFAIFIFCSCLSFGQDINFKKGIVYIDGKECLKYDNDGTNITFQNLNGDDIVYIKYLRPDGTQQSLYTKVIFVEAKQELTSKSYIFTKKALIEKLLKSNVLVNCQIVQDKVENFVLFS